MHSIFIFWVHSTLETFYSNLNYANVVIHIICWNIDLKSLVLSKIFPFWVWITLLWERLSSSTTRNETLYPIIIQIRIKTLTKQRKHLSILLQDPRSFIWTYICPCPKINTQYTNFARSWIWNYMCIWGRVSGLRLRLCFRQN